jgi:hypothetical protein
MTHYDKYYIYDNWVDKLINSHKLKLENLKKERNNTLDIQSLNFSQSLKSLRNFNEESIKLTQNNLENTLDSLLEENAKLKLLLEEKEKIIQILNNLNLTNDKNSDVFFEREKDLIETIKLLQNENKKLKEKNIDNQTSESCKLCANNKIYKQNSSTNNDTEILVIKYEKITDILTSFFSKYDKIFTEIKFHINRFDFENLRNTLADFQKDFKLTKNETIAISECISNQELSTKPESETNKNKPQILITNNENEAISALEKRIRELESNFMNMSKDEKMNSSIYPKKNLTNLSNVNSSQDLSKSVKRTQLYASKLPTSSTPSGNKLKSKKLITSSTK